MFKLDLEKAELTFTVSLKKKKNSRNTPISVSLTKPLAVWITTNSGKFFEMVKTDHLTCLLRNLYAGQEPDMKQQTGSNLGKEYIKAV